MGCTGFITSRSSHATAVRQVSLTYTETNQQPRAVKKSDVDGLLQHGSDTQCMCLSDAIRKRRPLAAFCPTNTLQQCSALKALQTHIASLISHSGQPETVSVKSERKSQQKLGHKKKGEEWGDEEECQNVFKSEWDATRVEKVTVWFRGD